jgi:hypothetical protein
MNRKEWERKKEKRKGKKRKGKKKSSLTHRVGLLINIYIINSALKYDEKKIFCV